MVKKVLFFTFFSLFSLLNAQEVRATNPLLQKVQSLVDTKIYEQNRAFIEIIFSPASDFYTSERIDVVKVVENLKANGLLTIFFKTPKELTLHFQTSGTPLFFVKIMSDTLRNMGYYRYVTKESASNEREFKWSISLSAEYVTDPLVLQKELHKSGCELVDIERISATEWTYVIDMQNGHLDAEVLAYPEPLELKRSLYSYWIDVSGVQKIEIKSSARNDWYPNISYYDASLHLLKVVKKETKIKKILLEVPKYAKYMKISDLYTIKNIKDSLVLKPLE
jgi:hypothetical protein